ncbi:hypothetical protein CR513_54579, partial [Mucuna pruriens]
MLQLFGEILDPLEGFKYISFDTSDLCLFPNIVIPPKFELLAFDKYGGTTCPKSHLTMYCRKILQNLAKREKEAFKEYALHWRELAARIQPPLSMKEMVTMFIDTLYPPFYERMVGNVSSNFSDLVVIELRIEVGMRKGKIVPEEATSHTNKSPRQGGRGRNEPDCLNFKPPTVDSMDRLELNCRGLTIMHPMKNSLLCIVFNPFQNNCNVAPIHLRTYNQKACMLFSFDYSINQVGKDNKGNL